MESNDTSVKCNNCGSSFINRQRRRKHYQKCQPIVNSESEPEASNNVTQTDNNPRPTEKIRGAIEGPYNSTSKGQGPGSPQRSNWHL